MTQYFVALQEDANINSEAKMQLHPQPTIVIQGEVNNMKAAYIAVEGHILCKVPVKQLPFMLLFVYYVFNLKYPSGCSNFYSFLEYLFLGVTPPKRSKLQHFLTSISNTTIL